MDEMLPQVDLGCLTPAVCPGTRPLSAGPATPPPAGEAADPKKQQLAKDFESILLTRLFAQVQQTLSTLNPEEEGTGRQVQGLFWLYLARDAADQGGLGLWKDIYHQLRLMDATPNPAAALDEEL